MLFSSPIFLFGFLPLVLIVYFIAADQYKNTILLVFSLLFYAWGEPKFIIVMLFSITLNFFSALIIDYFHKQSFFKRKKLALTISVVINIGVLVYFKYFNFFIDNLNKLLSTVTTFNFSFIDVIMPIGISFFTFQSMSYVIDVYREEAKIQKSILDLGLYVSLFPQLIAGPIVRYVDVADEINKRATTFNGFTNGVRRFIMGLGKKTLIANTVALVADNIFSLEVMYLTSSIAWVGIICYTLQIYFDFSGYSDMAIGLGEIFGFRFLENFNYPYASSSIKEFWNRWHISLSTWFRDYLYIPLGGNRKGARRTYINLLIVFFATGFWHGASWNFIFWGMFHGFFQITNRLGFADKLFSKFKIRNDNIFRKMLGHITTLTIVVVGWVFFRAENLKGAIVYLGRMLAITSPSQVIYKTGYFLTSKVLLIIIIAAILSTPIYKKAIKNRKAIGTIIEDGLLVLVLVLCMISLASSSYNPFIYFRF